MSSAESPLPSNAESPARIRKVSHAKSHSVESGSSRKSSRRSSHRIPSSKITGVLKELEDDIVSHEPLKLRGGGAGENETAPVNGKDEIYIENHGKFIKATKEVVLDNNYKIEFQDESWAFDITTPLDLVITIQNLWTHLGKILLGISAGLALTEAILILLYYASYQGGNFFDYYPVYSIFTNTFESLYYVLFVFGIISLLDWFDIAHIRFRDLLDALQYRKIWMIVVLYLGAAIIMFSLSSCSDFIYLQCNKHSTQKVARNVVEKDIDLISAVKIWNAGSLVKDIFIVTGWMSLVCLKSDDLFLLHLIEMKKYDYPYDRIVTLGENHI